MAEASNAQAPQPMPHWVTLLIAVIPAVATIIGGFWTLSTYLQNRADEQAKLTQTRLIEAKKPFLDKKFELYLKTTQVVSRFITEPDSIGREQWRSMWNEFWGPLYSPATSGL
jgi:hypothetical protein